MISMTPTKKMTSNLLYKGMSSIISMYTNKFKKNLFNKIEGLDKVEHEEIYKILMKNDDNVQLTKNSNGIFFNLSVIKKI
jgi:energy-converting hydrogenase A subunit M